eukprot:5818768-Amphidinium_carterae.1
MKVKGPTQISPDGELLFVKGLAFLGLSWLRALILATFCAIFARTCGNLRVDPQRPAISGGSPHAHQR